MTTGAAASCPRDGVGTRLRCAACGTPICPACQVATGAGAKCPDCAAPPPRPRGRHLGGLASAAGAVLLAASVVLVVRLLPAPARSPTGESVAGSWTAVSAAPGVTGGTSAVLLHDGRVLAAGGGSGSVPLAAAALFDPATRGWRTTGSLHQARRGQGAVVLPDGRVLVSGGIASGSALASAELYDPASGVWREAAPMHDPRVGHTLTELTDGRVLAAGGTPTPGGAAQASAELYDPGRNQWSETGGPMLQARTDASAVRLGDGRVLIAGGSAGADTAGDPGVATLGTAEVFEPAGGVFSSEPSMAEPRRDPTATVLHDGRVLVAGGAGRSGGLASAELLDLRSPRWTGTGSLREARSYQSASLLTDGEVLVTGGESSDPAAHVSLRTAELYDPTSGQWRAAATAVCPRSSAAQLTLPTGEVLVVGGDQIMPGGRPGPQGCTELFRL